jgi:hypothetical protein
LHVRQLPQCLVHVGMTMRGWAGHAAHSLCAHTSVPLPFIVVGSRE